MNWTVALTLVALLSGCAVGKALDSSYNKGVEAYRAKDYSAARAHWAKAAADDDVFAKNNLGYLLYYGLGGKPDQPRALVLWTQAALAGNSEAQWHLGQAFEDGKAVPRNVVEAYAWYRCAIVSAESATGEERVVAHEIAGSARKSLTKLLERLSKEEFATSESLAKEYIDKYARPRSR